MPVLLSTLGTLACAGGVPDGPLSAGEQQQIADTLRGVMSRYIASWSRINCRDQAAALQFFDYSGAGFIDVTAEAVNQYRGDSWPAAIRDATCALDREVAGIDSLLVRVLARDVAAVAWTYHSDYYYKDGTRKRGHGAVLQVFQRGSDGWKTPVAMSTHFDDAGTTFQALPKPPK